MFAMLLAAVFCLDQTKSFSIPTRPNANSVLAKVDGSDITASNIEDALWDWRAYEVVEDFIASKLLTAEAKKLGLVASDFEIEKEVEATLVEARDHVPEGQTLRQFLASQGSSNSRLWMRVRNKILLEKLVLTQFKPTGFVRVSTLVFRPSNEQVTALSDAIKKSSESYDALKKGEPWDKVLATTTVDENVLKAQGKVGWRMISAFPKSVQEEMKTLKAGEITKPAQTSNGIQIFRVDAFGDQAAKEDLKELQDLYLINSRTDYFNQLRDKAKIERFLR